MRSKEKVAALLATVVLVAACSGSGATMTPTATTPATTAPGGTSAASAQATTPSGAGKTLVYGAQGTPESFDPYLSEGGGYYPYLVPVYDTLIRMDKDGKPQPGLALSWQYNSDDTQFTMTLRTGVTFSDGTPFDADAVKANIERVKTVSGPRTGQLAILKDVTVISPSEVQVNLTSPNPSLPVMFSDVLGMMVNPKSISDPNLAKDPAGTGPYTLDTANTVVGSDYKFVRRSGYWDAANFPFQYYEVKVITDTSTLFQAVKSGDVDIAIQLNDDYTAAKAAGLQTFVSPVNFAGLFLLDRNGTKVPALSDVRVRQALNYAVDRQAIVNSVFNGLGTPAEQMLLPGEPGYDPTLNNTYTYDPAKAKALLAAAGYPNGFSMTVLSSPQIGLDQQAQAVAGYLDAVGVHVTLDSLAIGDYIPAFIKGQEPAAEFLWGTEDMFLDAQSLLLPSGAFNPFKANDPTMVDLWTRAAAASDADRPGLYQQLNARVTNQAWFLIVADQQSTMFVSPKVTNVQWWPNRITPSIWGWAPAS